MYRKKIFYLMRFFFTVVLFIHINTWESSFLVLPTSLLAPETTLEQNQIEFLQPSSPSVNKDAVKRPLLIPTRTKDLIQGRNLTSWLIQTALTRTEDVGWEIKEENDFYILFLDFNNFKLRNWMYSPQLVDVVLDDVDDEIAKIAETVERRDELGDLVVRGYSYKAGGDERAIVLPTNDPVVVEEVMLKIKTYIRRLLKQKYRVALLLIDNDSKIVKKVEDGIGGIPPREDLFQKVVHVLEEHPDRRIKVQQHAGQYYLVYENERDLESALLEIQQSVAEHYIDFRPFPHGIGLFDLFGMTVVGSSLRDTLNDLQGSAGSNGETILRKWLLRNDIASQHLNAKGKDTFLLIRPGLDILRRSPITTRIYRMIQSGEKKNRVVKDVGGEEKRYMNDLEWIERSSSSPGIWGSGEADGLYASLPTKKIAKEKLKDVSTEGYIVQVDVGYMSHKIRSYVAEFEKKIRTENRDLSEKDKQAKIRKKWNEKFRLVDPRLLGVNTKYLNEVFGHMGTNQLIKLLLHFFKDEFQEDQKDNKGDSWNHGVHIFRGPPDSVFIWFPDNSVSADEKKNVNVALKGRLQKSLNKIREQVREITSNNISLSYIVSVLEVSKERVPHGTDINLNDITFGRDIF